MLFVLNAIAPNLSCLNIQCSWTLEMKVCSFLP
uniref:Uncharacterized protein n=1 Tax=Anguilla anguilla TaxID=7936 RepID=A0A0E9XJG9_ANGAN